MSESLDPLAVSCPSAPATVGLRGGKPDDSPYVEARKASFNGELSGNGAVRFHNSKPDMATNVGHVKELPWHRMAAYMLVAGRTNGEIAMAAGVVPQTISILRAQRWFQELCATIADVEGQEVTGAVNSYALEAVQGIAQIAQTAESDRVRLSAYQILLEQAHGKPTQKIIASRGPNVLSPEEEMAELDRELSNLAKLKDEPHGT